MEAKTSAQIHCAKCNTVYAPAIKVLERVCPQCLSIKTSPVDVVLPGQVRISAN